MTTSVTGISNRPRLPSLPAAVASAAGFTLLELLVALVLISIIFTFAMLSFGGDDVADLMEDESRRLGALLALATDEAVMRGEELALRFVDEGYEFMQLQESGWQVPENDNLLHAYSIPAVIDLRLELEDDVPVIPGETEDPEALTPQVFILSSGEVTPFTLIFESRLSDAQYFLTVSLLGEITT
ncbi:MAG: type II secretion system minor pseudopilin GspH, partial [Thiohalobacterales bacterium]|nr:type II secretion system minor pseudopilin GspH [Thiohalobacterales bacterium]